MSTIGGSAWTGYTCANCGVFVAPNQSHYCNGTYVPYTPPSPINYITMTIDERIIRALERIADVLERFVDWELPDES